MTTPEFYYGAESYSGPFLSANEDPPEVESGPPGEYDQVYTDRQMTELRFSVHLMERQWNDATMNPDYNKRREAFEELELLAIRAERAIQDILMNVSLKCDEYDKETGL